MNEEREKMEREKADGVRPTMDLLKKREKERKREREGGREKIFRMGSNDSPSLSNSLFHIQTK